MCILYVQFLFSVQFYFKIFVCLRYMGNKLEADTILYIRKKFEHTKIVKGVFKSKVFRIM